MFAALIYSLALLSHTAEWALTLRLARVKVLQPISSTVPPTTRAAGAESVDTVRQEVPDLRVEQFGRIGVALTLVAWLLNVAGVFTRGLAADRVPWGNMYEFSITASVGIVGLYLVLLPLYHVRWLGLPLTGTVVTILMLAVLLLDVPAGPLVPALHSYWLYIHVTAAMIATGGFTVGGIASGLYLLKLRSETRPGGRLARILGTVPGVEELDLFAYRVQAFAFPVWTFAALIAGPIWAKYAWGRYWGWDPKEVWAFITWVAYAAYLHARLTAGWRGRRAAVLALVGLAALLFNFIGINLFGSGLHSYAGK
jgi:cytochrome c-type biogenesis protein CcsB